MASLSTYINKYGVRNGRRQYNASHREYKKQNRDKINAAQRASRKASK
jgi:hypothetical protein